MTGIGIITNDTVSDSYAYKLVLPPGFITDNVINLSNIATINDETIANSSVYSSSKVNELISDESLNSIKLKTTGRLLISNNMAILPSRALGDIVFNMAIIFDNMETESILYEVTVTTDGYNVIFDELDNLNGAYCVVSYLTKLE